MKRRTAVQATLGVAGVAILGCSEDESPATGGAGAGGSSNGGEAQGAGSEGGAGGSGHGGTGEGGAGEGGAGGGTNITCEGDGGLTPEQLLAGVETIVVLCMENRSFDHYLGSLQLVEGRTDVEGLDGSESNPAPDGSTVPVFNLTDFTPADPPHGWDAAHAQFDNGLNDGFVTEHAGDSQADVMGYHVREQIPITYALADAGAICDHWFASVMGPTWPNRFYLHGATSKGNKTNTPVTGFTSVFEKLDDVGVSNVNYYSDVPWCSGAYFKLGGLATIEKFFDDAAAGSLPQFSIIDPAFFGSGANDDHPDHDIQMGQALIASVYAALAQSPQWNKCLLVITYDEHGGFFDHVPPPETIDYDDEFTQMGFRVPTIVAGPFVKRGCVVSTTFEHVSIMKTLVTRFGIELINARVGAAKDLSSCIQAAYLDDPQPPVTLPQLTISMSKVLSRPAPTSHVEMHEAMKHVPAHLDRRAEGVEITKRFLAHAERLGVVKVVP